MSMTMGFEVVLMHYVAKFDTEKPHSGAAHTSVTKMRPIQLNLYNTILYITVQYNCALLHFYNGVLVHLYKIIFLI